MSLVAAKSEMLLVLTKTKIVVKAFYYKVARMSLKPLLHIMQSVLFPQKNLHVISSPCGSLVYSG